jgi:acyl-coenzyme A thioesterase PaaI-like protein
MMERPVTPPPPPPGFALMAPPGIFLNRTAFFFSRDEADGATSVGTWITPDQANSERVAHGGFLLTFADFALSYVLMGITLNLSVDFLRPAPIGEWLEARVIARRRSASLIFADTIATSNGREALRISGIFRPFEKRA